MIKLKKSQGFTLIELMIVVAIIGILAAVAIPKFADLVDKSKEAAVKGVLGSLRSAISIYYGDREGENASNLFEGLAFANKYMPAVSGVSSLGVFSIPKSKNLNPGHTQIPYNNVSTAAGVQQVATGTEAGVDNLPLRYATATGESWVSCSHLDSKSVVWSSY